MTPERIMPWRKTNEQYSFFIQKEPHKTQKPGLIMDVFKNITHNYQVIPPNGGRVINIGSNELHFFPVTD